ncbi:hypothetical protein FJ930_04300 [Mesorhizobium sp. B2-4-15]|nr:hypothetical protein FJ930_04300 [Mesorhizobium sp. B2-4-15]
MTNAFHTITVERAAKACVLSRGKARFLSIALPMRAIQALMPITRPRQDTGQEGTSPGARRATPLRVCSTWRLLDPQKTNPPKRI